MLGGVGLQYVDFMGGGGAAAIFELASQARERLQVGAGKTRRASKPLPRPMTGEMRVRLPPICFMTLSTMASPRPPPAPTDDPRTKGLFRASRVSEEMTATPLSSRICRPRSITISIGSSGAP